jgi:hypothetical protein
VATLDTLVFAGSPRHSTADTLAAPFIARCLIKGHRPLFQSKHPLAWRCRQAGRDANGADPSDFRKWSDFRELTADRSVPSPFPSMEFCMLPGYRIQLDERRALIRVWVAGTLNEELFATLETEAMAAARSLGDNHLALADLTEAEIQPLEIIRMARDLFEQSDAPARKVAIVVSSKLESEQARFLVVRPTIRMFRDAQKAANWLLAAS